MRTIVNQRSIAESLERIYLDEDKKTPAEKKDGKKTLTESKNKRSPFAGVDTSKRNGR